MELSKTAVMDSCWNETSNDDIILPLPEFTDLKVLEELLLDNVSDGSISSPSQASSINLDSCGEYAISTDGSLSSPQHSPIDDLQFQFDDSISNDDDDDDIVINEDKKKTKKTKKTKASPIVRAKETKRKRNERERRRVKKISQAFNNLKNAVPFSVDDKKLSKLDALKNAMMYIQSLDQMLKDDDLRREENAKIKTEEPIEHIEVNCNPAKALIPSPILTSAIPLQFINGSWSYYQLVSFPVSGIVGDPRLAIPHFGGYSHVMSGYSALKV